jgi:plasmid stability protein
MPMGAIQVKDVPEELHEALRRRAIEQGMTLADYVLDLIRRDLGLPSRREWFERLATREPVNLRPGEAAEALHAARAEREAQLAAALGLEEEVENEDAEGDAGRH